MEKKTSTFLNLSSKYRTSIMGLAMISIMLFHQCFISIIPFNLFHNFGNWGVDVFLFLSGMGLVKSLSNNSLTDYYLRRFKRIIPSCIFCGSLKYLIFLILGPSVAILKDGLNIGVWSIMSLDLWFIHAIIILYAICPFLYWSLKRWTWGTIALVLTLFWINGIFIKPEIGYDWLSPIGVFSWTTERLPVFVAGMYIVIKKDCVNYNICISFLFLIIAIGLVFLKKTEITFLGIQACLLFSLMIGMPALISFFIISIDKIPSMLLRIINFFGFYSLELYLVHEFIFWFLKISYDNASPFLLLIMSFLLSCFSAFVSKWFSENIKATFIH